jgi:molybdate transport system regulatory protein
MYCQIRLGLSESRQMTAQITNKTPALLTRLRVVCGGDIALGPGKADLLALVQETGSIRKAAVQMNMSYMRAWKLVQTMNGCFKEPLVSPVRGGRAGGGAQLTPTGEKALELYREMEVESRRVTKAQWKQLNELLAPDRQRRTK